MKQLIAGWEARYQFSETKLSERLNLNVPVTKSNFAQSVSAEFAQVCQLGTIIDEAISTLWTKCCANQSAIGEWGHWVG